MPPMLSSPNAILALKLLFLCLAFVVGARLAVRAVSGLAGKVGGGVAGGPGANGSEAEMSAGNVVAGVVLGALAGAKIVHAASYPELVAIGASSEFWILAAGYSLPGALAGAWIGLILAAPGRAGEWADAFLPAIISMLLIVDAGALIWSLTEPGYGIPARYFGINFGDGVRRHPVMLYDAAFLALMLWGNRVLQRQGWSVDGLRSCLLWAGYFAAVLLMAFLKPPFGPVLLLEKIHLRPHLYAPGLTAEQWLCIAVAGGLAVAAIGIFRNGIRGHRPR